MKQITYGIFWTVTMGLAMFMLPTLAMEIPSQQDDSSNTAPFVPVFDALERVERKWTQLDKTMPLAPEKLQGFIKSAEVITNLYSEQPQGDTDGALLVGIYDLAIPQHRHLILPFYERPNIIIHSDIKPITETSKHSIYRGNRMIETYDMLKEENMLSVLLSDRFVVQLTGRDDVTILELYSRNYSAFVLLLN